MATQTMRIRLKSYDHSLIDSSAERIVSAAKESGAQVNGPIPLPTKRSVYTVLRSPHVDKKSREQFEARVHKRVIDIHNATPKIVDALQKTEVPAGVEITIKMTGEY